jgi:hypothetical protein
MPFAFQVDTKRSKRDGPYPMRRVALAPFRASKSEREHRREGVPLMPQSGNGDAVDGDAQDIPSPE